MIRGQKKPLEDKQTINVDINTSIHNRFDIEVIDSRTGKVRQRAQAENIILNQLWSQLLESTSSGAYYRNGKSTRFFNAIHYGSGTATPNVSDISMTEFLGAKEIYIHSSTGSPSIETLKEHYNFTFDNDKQYVSVRGKIQIPETECIGKSIAEIGVGYNTSESSLCTKALLKDMNGNSLVINKTDTDVINIYATIFIHFNHGSGIQMMPVDFNKYCDITIQDPYATYVQFIYGYLSGIGGDGSDNWEQTIGLGYAVCFNDVKTRGNSYYASHYGSSSNIIRSLNDKTLKMVFNRIPVGEANFDGGIKYIAIIRGGCILTNEWYKLTAILLSTGDNTWYPGSTITGEAIGTGDGSTVNFSSKFRLHKNCKIMVNGSSVNNVTLDIDKDIAADSYNIHFTEPPAEGDVITADYFTDVIAKDENHVFDFSITFHFGEKVS